MAMVDSVIRTQHFWRIFAVLKCVLLLGLLNPRTQWPKPVFHTTIDILGVFVRRAFRLLDVLWPERPFEIIQLTVNFICALSILLSRNGLLRQTRQNSVTIRSVLWQRMEIDSARSSDLDVVRCCTGAHVGSRLLLGSITPIGIFGNSMIAGINV